METVFAELDGGFTEAREQEGKIGTVNTFHGLRTNWIPLKKDVHQGGPDTQISSRTSKFIEALALVGRRFEVARSGLDERMRERRKNCSLYSVHVSARSGNGIE